MLCVAATKVFGFRVLKITLLLSANPPYKNYYCVLLLLIIGVRGIGVRRRKREE
jgi:hypothetical protein